MTKIKAYALIPAAGMGKRMGAGMNKQYLQLNGRPILAHTLAVFEASTLIDGIMLVIPEDEIPYCREHIVSRFGFRKVLDIVPGGQERQHSVMNGLNALQQHAAPDDIVLIHDGVRPFVSESMLQASIRTVAGGESALVAVPAKDTIKIATNGIVVQTPDRETLWQAQTPQSFTFSSIIKAHQDAADHQFTGTDDASLIERSGGKVRIVMGDYRNIKITTPEDLLLAEAFCRAINKVPDQA